MIMHGFLSFLLFVVLLYVMMRIACSAHRVHGHHGGHPSNDGGSDKQVDPECGRHMAPNEGYGTAPVGR